MLRRRFQPVIARSVFIMTSLDLVKVGIGAPEAPVSGGTCSVLHRPASEATSKQAVAAAGCRSRPGTTG
jgi:hypothetical protein